MIKHPILFLSAASVAIAATAAPTASAQSNALEKRVDKLEKEMRAVQRSVFPGGSPTFFEGEIAPDANNGASTPRAGTNAPVIELTARVDALENQLQILTGQTEQNAFKLRELEQAFTNYKAEVTARFNEGAITPPTPAVTSIVPPASATTTPPAARPTTPSTSARPSANAASRAETERLALVKKVEVPVTGNEVQDGYDYGYRLWEAKLYPEAQTQLNDVVTKNPRHRLASYAQNLLGRAYLDEGKPSLAAVAFYNNYKDRPQGARAPHSLMYMGVALQKLGRKADACKAFQELQDVYGSTMPQDVRNDANAAKTKAGC